MMNLTEETMKIYAARDVALVKLQAKFAKDQKAFIDGEDKLRADHGKQLDELAEKLNKALEVFIIQQEAGFQNLQDSAQKEELAIQNKAQAEVDELAKRYQAELLAENEKAQAVSNDALDELSTEALLTAEMEGMTAAEIAADYKVGEVRKAARFLKLDASGKELEVAQRITDALSKVRS